jgi:hypothetical protein
MGLRAIPFVVNGAVVGIDHEETMLRCGRCGRRMPRGEGVRVSLG